MSGSERDDVAAGATPFWRFSLAFYGQPGVPALLLPLQDRSGADVNLVLFGLWRAAQRHALSPQEFAALDETVRFAAGVHLFEDWEFFARVARRAPLAFVDLPTTVNVGHPDPHRVSSCDPLTRARCYVDLLERVWLADPAFAREQPEALKSALSRGLLAVSRQALLAGDRPAAVDALNRWRSLGTGERSGWARVYSACAALPAGGALLRNLLRGRLAAQLVTGRGLGDHPVNPAA